MLPFPGLVDVLAKPEISVSEVQAERTEAPKSSVGVDIHSRNSRWSGTETYYAAAWVRYWSQHFGTWPAATVTQASRVGAVGLDLRSIEHSDNSRFAFVVLHLRQHATTFVQICSPPRDLGTTWSIDSAFEPQYWHRPWSLANIALRFNGAVRWYGTRTK